MSNVGSDTDRGEREQEALGQSIGFEEVARQNLISVREEQLEALRTGKEFSYVEAKNRRGEAFNGALQHVFNPNGSLNEEALYVREVEGVNYRQTYIVPTLSNLRNVLRIVEEQGLKSKGADQQIADIKAILTSKNSKAKKRLIESIQQIRLFDARDKVLTEEGQAVHPISILNLSRKVMNRRRGKKLSGEPMKMAMMLLFKLWITLRRRLIRMKLAPLIGILLLMSGCRQLFWSNLILDKSYRV